MENRVLNNLPDADNTHLTQNFDFDKKAEVRTARKNNLLNENAALSFGEKLEENKIINWLEIAKKSVVPQGVELPQPVTLFELKGIPIMTKNEMSLLIAKPKQGKSTVASWIVAQLLSEEKKVLVLDTEQGQYYSSRSQYWTLSSVGLQFSLNLTYLDLKKFSPGERLNIINAYLAEYGQELDLIVLDGVRDLVIDINQSSDFMPIINELMRWTVDYDLHILNILHKNKVDANARGGIGTELQNKCETTIDVSLEGAQIVVSPIYTRNQVFEPFVIIRDTYGIPKFGEDYTPPVSEMKRKQQLKWYDISIIQHTRLLKDVFTNDFKPSRRDLLTRLASIYGSYTEMSIGGRLVDSLLDYLLNDVSLIIRIGKERSPLAYYSLATDNTTEYSTFQV